MVGPMSNPVVIVECDRCHREVTRMSFHLDGLGARVVLGGYRVPDDTPAHVGNRPSRYATRTSRGGAFILQSDESWVDPSKPVTGRETLVCHGRKHPRYPRVTTEESRTRAYWAAVAAGRTRIG